MNFGKTKLYLYSLTMEKRIFTDKNLTHGLDINLITKQNNPHNNYE